MKITKAIIPIAGKGTRFLPITKAISKEIIPIINTPMIFYIVQEAVKAGLEQIIFVTSRDKDEVIKYFDRHPELEDFLEQNGKEEELELVKKISQMVEIISVRQKEQLGLGHAIYQAHSLISPNENFAVLLGDDIVVSKKPAIEQLMKVSSQYDNSSVIGIMKVDPSQISRYGIVEGKHLDDKTVLMEKMIEKPKVGTTQSCLACPGRYILSSEIMDVLKKIPKGAGGEFQLTDAIGILAGQKKVYAHLFEGERFDTGNITGYLDALVEFSLAKNEFRADFIQSVKTRFKKHGITL
jgi:UTP--glucose-1-phosphate uridylyltransferase